MLRKIYRFAIVPYTIFLLYLMFFGFGRTVMEDNIVRFQPFVSTIGFVKNSILYSRYLSIIINIFGNIIMFVPFGFLGWKFQKFTDFKTLMLNFLSAIIIVEGLQYFTKRGVFDVDDILLNSFGVMIGFYLMKFLSKK